MANKNLSAARAAKNDEFYTRLTDIENELWNYRTFFKDKIVYCNCDDGQWSNFWRYFYINFEFLGLKELIATSYHDGISHTEDPEDIAYKYSYKGGYGKTNYVANGYMEGVTKTRLEQKGDFRSEECIEILKTVDVVVTNPPFSLFRDFVATLEKYNKKFLIIGNQNAITYKEIFPLIKDNKLWEGYNMVKEFTKPDGTIQKFGNIMWFTNVDSEKRHHILECYSRYNPDDYPKYDNYDAIECGKCATIPCDYTGVIGVPITFIDNFCPEQFELLGADESTGIGHCENLHEEKTKPQCIINGKNIYKRLFIRWKPEAMPHIDEDGVITYEKV